MDFELQTLKFIALCVCDHLSAVEEPESAPAIEVLTAMAKLLRYTLTHRVNEMVDCFLLVSSSSVVWFHTWMRMHLEGRGG